MNLKEIVCDYVSPSRFLLIVARLKAIVLAHSSVLLIDKLGERADICVCYQHTRTYVIRFYRCSIWGTPQEDQR
jgi:hypothetical protein